MSPSPAGNPAIVLAKSFAVYAIGIALAFVIYQFLGPALGEYHRKILITIGINIIMAASLNIVNGYTGQFSLGHAAFMAAGGYTAGWVTYYGSFMLWKSPEVHGGLLGPGDWLFVAGCLAGGLVAALFGLLVGLPSLRLRGDYLAIVTLGFGEILRVLMQQTGSVLKTPEEIHLAKPVVLVRAVGGALGFDGIPKYTNLFWVYAFAAVTLIICFRLKESIHGRAFLAVRENEIAAEAMGIPTTRFKVSAFVIAAFFAGIGGGLYAHDVGVLLNARELAFQRSLDFVIMVVLGGMGSISGSVFAAIILTILPELLRNLHDWKYAQHLAGQGPAWSLLVDLTTSRLIVFAVLLILMMILRPQGLMGLREIWDWKPLRRWIHGEAKA